VAQSNPYSQGILHTTTRGAALALGAATIKRQYI